MATATATAEEVERGALAPAKLATLVEAFEAHGFACLGNAVPLEALRRLEPRMDADAAQIVATGGQDRGAFGNGRECPQHPPSFTPAPGSVTATTDLAAAGRPPARAAARGAVGGGGLRGEPARGAVRRGVSRPGALPRLLCAASPAGPPPCSSCPCPDWLTQTCCQTMATATAPARASRAFTATARRGVMAATPGLGGRGS